ncbi:MAG: PEP-CTERM sorting domain-containing protein [Planctomycetia bacterium]|nr:PEP-CTERM sorting domain-containing protein [Planctomycetia bacterium]
MKSSRLTKTAKLASACVALGIASSTISAWSATWTGQDGVTPVTDLSNGGEVTERTFLNLQNNETVTISNVLSGSQGFTVNGPGTLELKGKNTYTGTFYLSKGTTDNKTILKLSTDGGFSLGSATEVVMGANSVINLGAGNAFGYAMNGSGMCKTLTMKGNGLITTSVSNTHSNLPNIAVVTETKNNKIEALNGVSASHGVNYFLAGKIALEANSTLDMDVEGLYVRRPDASLIVNEERASGIFDIASGSTLTIGTSKDNVAPTIHFEDGGSFRKRGEGTMNVNGTIRAASASSSVLVENGTLNATLIEMGGAFLVKNGTVTVTELNTWSAGSSTFTGGTATINTLDNSGDVSVTGGTLKITGAITGAGAVAVDGGTLNLAGELAYNKDLNVTKGGTLNVSVANAMKNGTISLDNGQLLITAGNAFGYNNDGKGTMPNINMANGSTITSSANNHSNIGNITASGTGNIITAAEGDTGSPNFGNLFFVGKVVVADNSDLTIDLHKATLRTGNGAIMENEKNVSGVFDVGENSTVTANIDTLRFQCTNGQASFEKTGVGDMFLNGTISKDAIIKVTEGTLNLNTTVNTTDQNLGAPADAKPTITVTDGGTLGTGDAKGEIGTLNLAESTVTLDGGRLEVDLSSASSDMYTFDTLILKDDAQIELVWLEGEDYAEKYENIIVAEIVDENGDYIKNLLDYMTGSLLDKYNLQNVGNAWSLVLAGGGPVTPGSEVPEPSTVLLLLLGTGFLAYSYRKNKKD